MSYEDYRRKVIAAQEQWNKDRDWIYKTENQGNYGTEFSGDIQPNHITTPDSFDHMDLAAMQKSVDTMNPKYVDNLVTAWANVGATLTGGFSKFQQQFAKTINGDNGHSGWRGAAATAAVNAVNNYSDKSTHLAHAATVVSLKLSEMKTGLEETQSLMPGVTTPTSVAGKTLPTDGVMKVDDHNQQEATQEARRILTTVYGPVAGQTDTGVPYLPTAPQITPGGATGPVGPVGPNPVTPVPPGGATGPANTGASGPTETGASGPDSGRNPGATGAGESATGPSATATGPADTADTADTKTQSYSPTTQSGTPSANTAGYSPTASPGYNAPGSVTSPNLPGYTPGSGPSGSPDSGPRSPSPNAPGRSVPSVPGVAQPAAASAASTAAAARAGTPGMTGMSPGAAGKGKGEDSEKSGTPDYLVTKEHGEELTGLADQAKMVPPVIGGDYDAPKY